MQKYFNIWKNHIQLKKQIQYLTINKFGYVPDNYMEMIVHSQQLMSFEHLKQLFLFFQHIFNIMETTGHIIPNIPGETRINVKYFTNFMSCFMINHFPETNCTDTTLLNVSKQLEQQFEHIKHINGIIPLKDIIKFTYCFYKYSKLYRVWEQSEKNTAIEELSQTFWTSYAYLYQHIQAGKDKLKYLQDLKVEGEIYYENTDINTLIVNAEQNISLWKVQFQEGFHNLKHKALETIKQIDPQNGIKYFESLVPIFIDPSFNDNMRNMVHKVFWESLVSDLNEGKFDKLITLFTELKTYMMACVPNREDIHHEINMNIDIELWQQMLKYNAYQSDNIVGLFNYVLNHIKNWISIEQDNDFTIFHNELINKINNKEKLSELVYFFLMNSFKFLENIILQVQEFQSTEEYRILRHKIKSSNEIIK